MIVLIDKKFENDTDRYYATKASTLWVDKLKQGFFKSLFVRKKPI